MLRATMPSPLPAPEPPAATHAPASTAPARSACVLALLGDAAQRSRVRRGCAAQPLPVRLLEAASVTDAVLSVLSQPIDLVLVDLAHPDELLRAMLRHVRRSRPQARIVGLRDLPQPSHATHPPDLLAGLDAIHPWSELEPRLDEALRRAGGA